MKNYKPRYLIEVDSIRGDMDSPRMEDSAYDDREVALGEVERIGQFRNVYLTDRRNQTSRKPEVLYYGAGYYDLPFRANSLDALDHYMRGKIDRLTDQALDAVDDKALEMEREFNRLFLTKPTLAKNI